MKIVYVAVVLLLVVIVISWLSEQLGKKPVIVSAGDPIIEPRGKTIPVYDANGNVSLAIPGLPMSSLNSGGVGGMSPPPSFYYI